MTYRPGVAIPVCTLIGLDVLTSKSWDPDKIRPPPWPIPYTYAQKFSWTIGMAMSWTCVTSEFISKILIWWCYTTTSHHRPVGSHHPDRRRYGHTKSSLNWILLCSHLIWRNRQSTSLLPIDTPLDMFGALKPFTPAKCWNSSCVQKESTPSPTSGSLIEALMMPFLLSMRTFGNQSPLRLIAEPLTPFQNNNARRRLARLDTLDKGMAYQIGDWERPSSGIYIHHRSLPGAIITGTSPTMSENFLEVLRVDSSHWLLPSSPPTSLISRTPIAGSARKWTSG